MLDIIKYIGENIFSVFVFTLFILFVIYNLLFLIRVASWAWNSKKASKPSYTKPLKSTFRRFRVYKNKGKK